MTSKLSENNANYRKDKNPQNLYIVSQVLEGVEWPGISHDSSAVSIGSNFNIGRGSDSKNHCVKSVQIRRFFVVHIFPYSD